MQENSKWKAVRKNIIHKRNQFICIVGKAPRMINNPTNTTIGAVDLFMHESEAKHRLQLKQISTDLKPEF